MSNGRSALLSDYRRNDHYLLRNTPVLTLELCLRYEVQGDGKTVTKTASFSPATTIYEVAHELVKFARLDTKAPKNIILVSFHSNNKTDRVPFPNSHKTLGDLTIPDGSKLNFQPSSLESRRELSNLTIYGPDDIIKVEYQWDKTKTTLAMLFDDVITLFSLESIEPQCIHLIRLSKVELDLTSDSNKLLSDLGIDDYTWISVKIVSSRSSSTTNRNMNVHVECSYFNGKLILDVPITITIQELHDRIEHQFKNNLFIDFDLYNTMVDKLNLNDKNRRLGDLGIKSGQTIYATIRLGVAQNPPRLINSRVDVPLLPISTLSKKQKNDEATVHCRFSSYDSETIRVSVKDTVAQLTEKISALRKDQPLAQFMLWSGIINIDDKQPDRCLADFGIKPGSTINASMFDATPIHHSISSRRVAQSYTPSRQFRDDPKPIGLDNLGNTCFMNSALQCLVHVKPLTQFFLDSFARTHSEDNGHMESDWNPFDTCGDVTGAYAELIWNLLRRDQNDYYYQSFKPERIKETIGRLAPRFATYDQQDAQEFLTFLLNALHDEFKEQNKPDRNTIINQLFFGTMQSTITCLKCKHVETTNSSFSFLPLPLNRQEHFFSINFIKLDGQQDSAVVDVPTCARVEHLVLAFTEARHNYLLFYRIYAMMTNTNEHLPFETRLSELPDREVTLIEQEEEIDRYRRLPDRCETQPYKLTLEECLREFVSLEQLEDRWFCQQDGCNDRMQASKQLQLTTLPSILVIQLKRFSHGNGMRNKLDTLVEYPLNGLDLSSLLQPSEQAIYDLIAVSNHIGSIYGGHYIAYARQDVSTDKWYKLDDSYVSTVYYPNDIVSRDAYLLFYVKRNEPKGSSETKTTTC